MQDKDSLGTRSFARLEISEFLHIKDVGDEPESKRLLGHPHLTKDESLECLGGPNICLQESCEGSR